MRTETALSTGLALQTCLLFAMTTAAAGQDRQVVVSMSVDPELRRAAHRLRLCESDLRQLRAALEEATELTVHSEDGVDFAAMLGYYWPRIYQLKAVAGMRRLVESLRDRASTDPAAYQRATGPARRLMAQIRELDPGLAALLEADWPEPPRGVESVASGPSEGGQADWYRRSEERATFEDALQQDPSRAWELLHRASGSDQLRLRAQLLSRLGRSGDLESAGALLDETLTLPVQTFFDDQVEQTFPWFAQQATQLFPERTAHVLDYFQQLLDLLHQDPSLRDYPLTPEQKLQVTRPEQAVLNMIQGLQQQPETAVRLFGMSPELQARLAPMGGLDGFFSARRGFGRRMEEIHRDTLELSAQELADKYSDVEDPSFPITAADMLCRSMRPSDPARADILVHLALRRIASLESLQQAANSYLQLTQSVLSCDGELNASIRQAGEDLLARFREEGKEAAHPPATTLRPGGVPMMARQASWGPSRNPEHSLAARLLAAGAFDPATGLQSIRSEPDEKLRLAAFVDFFQLKLNR